MRKIYLLALITQLVFANTYAQVKKESLLWKIEGKGLKKPSYLFGTIHLQDKRVFNFSDSVYAGIENTDAFAMEIHPDSVSNGFMKELSKQLKKDLIKEKMKPADYEKFKKKIKDELNIDADKLSVRDAYYMKQRLSMPVPKKDDMPTFVDMFLQRFADQKNKKTIGLEKTEDQLELFDELRNDFDLNSLLKEDKPTKNLLERLISLYEKEEISKVPALMTDNMNDATEDKMLYQRNHLMVAKIDSLLKTQSLFTAVGLAHLPGKDGIIELLEKRGYTVSPVITTTRTHGSTVALDSNRPWVMVKDEEEGYSIEMPGQPSAQTLEKDAISMKMYMDMATMRVYYIMHTTGTVTITPQNRDSLFTLMINYMLKNSDGKLISRAALNKEGTNGEEVIAELTKDKMFMKLQVVTKDQQVYIVAAASKYQKELGSEDFKRYFASLKLADFNKNNTWSVHTNRQGSFSIEHPGVLTKQETTENNTDRYVTMDKITGNYYAIITTHTKPDNYYNNDQLFLQEAFSKIFEKIDTTKTYQLRDTVINGCNAKMLTGETQGLLLNYATISRTSRIYIIFSLSDVKKGINTDILRFFNSFKFLPYPKLIWQTQRGADNDFSTETPGKIILPEFDSTEIKNNLNQYAFDDISGISYYIIKEGLSRYQWTENDTTLLGSVFRYKSREADSVSNYTVSPQSSSVSGNFHYKHSNYIKKIQIHLNGDTIYQQMIIVNNNDYTADMNNFFTEFSILKKNNYSLKNNSFQKLISDIKGADSTLADSARKAIGQLFYTRTDLNELLKAALDKYSIDSSYFNSTNNMFAYELKALVQPEDYEKVYNTYISIPKEREEMKFSILELLIKTKHPKAISTAIELFCKQPPTEGHSYQLFSLLSDSPTETAPHINQLLQHITDSISGLAIIELTKNLLDSTLIKTTSLFPFSKEMLQAANQLYQLYQHQPDEFDYRLNQLLYLIYKTTPDSTDRYIQMFSKVTNNGCRYNMAEFALSYQRNLPRGLLDSIAADAGYRLALNRLLKEKNKETLFPPKYLNQKDFAESYIYNSLEDEYPSEVKFIGTRVKSYKGSNSKFYLYKVTFEYKETTETYLGVSGPFPVSSKSLIPLEEYFSGLYYEENFDEKKINELFENYLTSSSTPPEEEELEED